MDILVYFLQENVTLSWTFGSERGASPTVFKTDQPSNFIITSTEDDPSHKCVVQNAEVRLERGISKLIKNSVLISTPDSLSVFYETRAAAQTAILKTKHSRVIQSKDILTRLTCQ